MPDDAALPKLSSNATTQCWGNLNKLDWPHGFAFTSYGVPMGVRVSDPSLIPVIKTRLPRDAEIFAPEEVERYFSIILGGRQPGSRVRAFNIAYLDHSLLARSHKLDDVLDACEAWFRLSIGELAPEHVFVHAGVVGWKGRAIIVPGKSLSGKSTLVAELVKAGATYYSDEFAVFEADGRVHPYIKPLSMRANPTARQTDVAVEDIGGRIGKDPLPVGLVVMSEYQPRSRWQPRSLSPGGGALELLANALSARHSPERTLKALSRIASEAPVIKSKRGEADVAAKRILQLLDSTL